MCSTKCAPIGLNAGSTLKKSTRIIHSAIATLLISAASRLAKKKSTNNKKEWCPPTAISPWRYRTIKMTPTWQKNKRSFTIKRMENIFEGEEWTRADWKTWIATQFLLGWYCSMNSYTNKAHPNWIATPPLLRWYRSMNYDTEKANTNWIIIQPRLGWDRSINYY